MIVTPPIHPPPPLQQRKCTLDFACFLMIGLAASLVTNPIARADEANVPLRLSMEDMNEEIVLGEPLHFRVTLENVSDKVLFVAGSSESFQVQSGPDGEKLKDASFTRVRGIAGLRPPVILEENQRHSIDFTLFMSLDQAVLTKDAKECLIFTQPGRHKIVVQYDIGDVMLEDSSSVLILAPQGDDAQAWEEYRDLGVISYLQWKGAMPPDIVQLLNIDQTETNKRIDDIINRFPETLYGRILRSQRNAEKPRLPDPQAEFDRILARLKSQRYDVEAICREHRALYDQEVKPGRLALINEAAAGRISWEQCYAEHGRLIEDFVKKYGSPMSEEKWNEMQENNRNEDVDIVR